MEFEFQFHGDDYGIVKPPRKRTAAQRRALTKHVASKVHQRKFAEKKRAEKVKQRKEHAQKRRVRGGRK